MPLDRTNVDPSGSGTDAGRDVGRDTSSILDDREPLGSYVRPFVSIVIPARDEERSIGYVLTSLPSDRFDEIVVVDNGSSDRTRGVAESAGVRVVEEPRVGYGSACLAGIAALDPRTEIVVFLDADFSDDPEDISKLLEPIVADRADFVVGTRTTRADSRAALLPQQRWGNRLAVALIHLVFGFEYSDLGPFRAIRASSLRSLEMKDRNFGWTVEMQIRAIEMGLRIEEVPVRYRIRIGRSKISGTVKGVLCAGAKIIYTIATYALRARRTARSDRPREHDDLRS